MAGTETEGRSVHEILRETEEELNLRIRTLERRQRIASRWALASGSLAGFAILITLILLYSSMFHGLPGMGSRVLRAREVVLTDSRGNERGRWVAEEDGSVRLALVDAAGQEVLRLSARSDGAGVALADSAGNARVVLAFLKDQSGSLAFADRRGTARTILGFGADESSSVLFADRNGLARAAMGVSSLGSPEFLWPDGGGVAPAPDEPAEDVGGPPGGF